MCHHRHRATASRGLPGVCLAFLLVAAVFLHLAKVEAFVPPSSMPALQHSSSFPLPHTIGQNHESRHSLQFTTQSKSKIGTSTALNAILDVPYGTFTAMGFFGAFLQIILRPVNRQILEERAWQSRLEDSRKVRQKQDPTLTELDLIREEAEMVPGPYGPDAMERREREAELKKTRKSRVMVMDDEEDEYYDDDEEDEYYDDEEYDFEDRYGNPRRRRRKSQRSSYTPPPVEAESKYVPMTDEEIEDFEAETGLEYDPYYDEPYEEDELPTDVKCYTDGMFLDKRYDNGEVFYYDEDIDMYWRQGCKPRIKKLFQF